MKTKQLHPRALKSLGSRDANIERRAAQKRIVGMELDRSTRVFARNGERRETQSKRDCEMVVMQLLFHCTQ